MKRVRVASEEYEIRFHRYQNDDGVMETNCLILHVFGEHSMVPVAQASVKLHHKDQDIKKLGYKHALTTTLANSVFDKPERAVVWNAMKELWV